MMRLTPACCMALTLLPASVYAVPANSVTDIHWDKDNTVRVGESINTVYRIAMADGSSNHLWLNVDCATQAKTLLYMNLQLPGGKKIRAYGGNSFARYIPGVPFEPDADSPLSTDPVLDICQQKVPQTRWVALSGTDKAGDQPLIDVNNSHREGNILTLRLATDYAQIHREDKYAAPYDFKISQMQVNCSRRQARVERTFSLNNQFVTDDSATPDTAFTPLPSPLAASVQTLCSLENIGQFTGSGPQVERQKTAANAPLVIPDFENNDPSALAHFPLPAAVNGVIQQALKGENAAPTFSRLTFTQVWPGNDDSHAVTRIDRLPDGSTLTLDTLMLKGVTFYSQYQRLFNIVNLKEWDSMQNSPLIGQSVETNFSAAPVVGQQYRWKTVLKNEKETGNTKTKSQVCLVERQWHDASMLNEKFPGRYIELSCTDDRGDGRAMSSDYAWLENLRIFIRIGYQEEGQKKRFTFKDVAIIR